MQPIRSCLSYGNKRRVVEPPAQRTPEQIEFLKELYANLDPRCLPLCSCAVPLKKPPVPPSRKRYKLPFPAITRGPCDEDILGTRRVPAFYAKGNIVIPPKYRPEPPDGTSYKKLFDDWRKKAERFASIDDDLDFILRSVYNHSIELFPEKPEVYKQNNETYFKVYQPRSAKISKPWNEEWPTPANVAKIVSLPHELEFSHSPWRANKFHPLIIAPSIRKISPHSLKLATESPHSAMTKNGYSRKKEDGCFFFG